MNLFWWSKKREPTGHRYSDIKYISSFGDAPKELGNTIFIVKNGDKKKWAIFSCPDNCGRRVEVNLMKSKIPFWHLKIKRGKVTLYPSIVVKGCNAHFWLVDNKINWSFTNID
jgi:hypothetical protein